MEYKAHLSLLAAIGLILVLMTHQTAAQGARTLANCGASSGWSYFPFKGMVPEKEAGWQRDGIGGGKTTLVRLADGEYDLLFVDVTGKVRSSRNDGGAVIKLREGNNHATFLVIYEVQTAEIYTFFKDNKGRNQYIIMSSKDSQILLKSSVFVGDCDFISLD
jgi:hypothetical protein